MDFTKGGFELRKKTGLKTETLGAMIIFAKQKFTINSIENV
jgi:hypothetical protein